MTELIKPSKTEAELLGQLLSGKNKAVEVSIPDDLDPKIAVRYSRDVAALLDKNDSERAILLHVAGRLHYLARTNPEILREAKCASLDDYLDTVLNCKDHRSTVYKWSTSYEKFPTLTPAMAAEIGTTNLYRAAKALPENASPKQRQQFLEKAAELSTDNFKEWVEQKSGVSAQGATEGASFLLIGSKEEIDSLKEDLAEPRFTEFAGDERPIGKINAAIAESKDLWPKEQQRALPGAKPIDNEGGW